jgi:hypothetical protein
MSGEVYAYAEPVMATAVPYSDEKSPLPAVPDHFNSDSSIYGDSNPGPWIQDDAIERSSNIFNQVSIALSPFPFAFLLIFTFFYLDLVSSLA